MFLVTMAHLGEAQHLIKDYALAQVSQHYFEGPELACLITGEGPFEAATQVAQTLTKRPFQKVINLGICGSLSDECEIGKIYPVETCYLVVDGKPQFKSFPTGMKGPDLITSFERVLTPEKALMLKGLGRLVDREAWGVAFACKTVGVPFECYKLVSDKAGTLNACEAVQDLALEFSAKLSLFLQQSENLENKGSVHLSDKRFHFTFAMRKSFEGLIHKLSIHESLSPAEVLASLPLDVFSGEKTLPKDRARDLITYLEERLDPFSAKLRKRLGAWKNRYPHFDIQTDPQWESSKVTFSFDVANRSELEAMAGSLLQVDLETFHDLQQGKLNVE